jgi:hypothetical protein
MHGITDFVLATSDDVLLAASRGAAAWFSPRLVPSSRSYKDRWIQLGGCLARANAVREQRQTIDVWFGDATRSCLLVDRQGLALACLCTR